MKKNTIIGIAVAAIAVIIAILIGISMSGNNNTPGDAFNYDDVIDGAADATPTPQDGPYTPVFTYIVHPDDEDYTEYMATVEELKKEYEGKVEFDIRDAKENPEAIENFGVEGMTPSLFMLDTHADIITVLFDTKDKGELIKGIDLALGVNQ